MRQGINNDCRPKGGDTDTIDIDNAVCNTMCNRHRREGSLNHGPGIVNAEEMRLLDMLGGGSFEFEVFGFTM